MKHRVPFPFSTRVFLDPKRVELDVSRESDGEPRFKVVGAIDGKLYVVVATWRGDVCRVISAGRANAAEGKAYGRG